MILLENEKIKNVFTFVLVKCIVIFYFYKYIVMHLFSYFQDTLALKEFVTSLNN